MTNAHVEARGPGAREARLSGYSTQCFEDHQSNLVDSVPCYPRTPQLPSLHFPPSAHFILNSSAHFIFTLLLTSFSTLHLSAHFTLHPSAHSILHPSAHILLHPSAHFTLHPSAHSILHPSARSILHPSAHIILHCSAYVIGTYNVHQFLLSCFGGLQNTVLNRLRKSNGKANFDSVASGFPRW